MSTLFSILFQQKRAQIGGINLDASISEEHVSECDVTENPIEDGAIVTDHVHVKPAQLTIEGIVSDTPITFAVINNVVGFVNAVNTTILGNSSRSTDAYNALIDLQKSREPFTVITGLRVYKDMIMTSLSVPRDAQRGKAVNFTAELKQIIIAKSKTATPASSSAVSKIAAKQTNVGPIQADALPPWVPISGEPSAVSSGSLASQIYDGLGNQTTTRASSLMDVMEGVNQ